MRPLELRLRNFRSYFGDETTFSFRDRSLVGIVGPIGSGKSSILDAVAFALYGKTPTVAAATKGLIHQRAAEATVALRFEVEGEIWEAVRMLRIKGQSQHALYRLSADAPGEEPTERITMESDVNAKIVELLGLEFDAFGRSVLLAQGRFAEFLRARPAERDKVLKGVFGHDRIDAMRETAKVHAAQLGLELEKLAVRVEQLDRVATRLAERRTRSKAADLRVDELRKAQPELEDLAEQLSADRQAVESASKRRREIRELAGRLPDPNTTAQLFADAAGVADRRAGLATDLETAQQVLHESEVALAELESAGIVASIEGAAERLGVVSGLRKALGDARERSASFADRLAQHRSLLAQARERRSVAERAETTAHAALAESVAALETAEESVVELRHANMAMTLRGDMHDGDICPVCSQEVKEVPPVGKPEDLVAAEAAVTDARHARERADAVRVTAAAEAQGAREALEALEMQGARFEAEQAAAAASVTEAQSELDAALAVLADLLGEGDPAELLDELRHDLDRRRRAADGARKTLERVRSDHDAVIRDQQETAKRLTALRVDIADFAARIDAAVLPDSEHPDALQRALDALRDAWNRVTGELDAQIDAASQRIAAGEASRSTLLDEVGVDGEFAPVLANAVAEAELLSRSIAEDQAELDGSASLLAQRDDLTAERARFEQVATDLTDSRFVRYLLDDERTRLAALGSEHFEQLSSGRYRFTEDGTFAIVDLTAAEAVRKADSLSGGETFLASLALALALAEMVARTGGRLDAFFLDEGFGSLDPEHLDLAMEGIEALVADGSDRLVVVVSHVPEMRSRLEDLIVLDRNPVTGDTQVMSA